MGSSSLEAQQPSTGVTACLWQLNRQVQQSAAAGPRVRAAVRGRQRWQQLAAMSWMCLGWKRCCRWVWMLVYVGVCVCVSWGHSVWRVDGWRRGQEQGICVIVCMCGGGGQRGQV